MFVTLVAVGLYFFLDVLLLFPLWALCVTFVLSLWVYGPLERSRFKYYRSFIIRPGAQVRALSIFYIFGWVLFQAILLSVLAYLLSCQCKHNEWARFIFPISTTFLLLIIHSLHRSQFGTNIYLLPYAYARLVIPIGLLQAFLFTYLPSLFEESPIFIKRLLSSMTGLIRFGGSAIKGDMCTAYVQLDKAISQLTLSFPTPFDYILSFVLNTEITYGFLILLYAWSAYRILRWRRVDRVDEYPP